LSTDNSLALPWGTDVGRRRRQGCGLLRGCRRCQCRGGHATGRSGGGRGTVRGVDSGDSSTSDPL